MAKEQFLPAANSTPLNVVIVGGSLAGLMHGVMLKTLGHNVRILEQCTTSRRVGLAAGITVASNISAFFDRFDRVAEKVWAVRSERLQAVRRDAAVDAFRRTVFAATSWDVLYYRLRARFDGKEGKTLEGLGCAKFYLGKKVSGLKCEKGLVTVKYDDLLEGTFGTIHADLVIAADGANSSVRQLLRPDVERRYAGYLAWRGTIPEKQVSQHVRNLVGERRTLRDVDGNHFFLYLIAGKDGSIQPGKRLLSLMWYIKTPDSSALYDDALTDIGGRNHSHTVLPGMVQPAVWERQKEHARQKLPLPYADLFAAIERPFMTAASDLVCPQASFFDGKVLLVGDALALQRSTDGLSTDQAATHCLLLEKVLKGEMSIQRWEMEVLRHTQMKRLRSIPWSSAWTRVFLGSAVELLVVSVVGWFGWLFRAILSEYSIVNILIQPKWVEFGH